MKKFVFATLLLMLCAAPAFAWHRKPHKDPRVVDHPKGQHVKNQQYKQAHKIKVPKHKTN
jgi:hypothetical protein